MTSTSDILMLKPEDPAFHIISKMSSKGSGDSKGGDYCRDLGYEHGKRSEPKSTGDIGYEAIQVAPCTTK